MKYRFFIITFLLMVFSCLASAQHRSIEGKVFDDDARIPLEGAAISIPETTSGTITDEDGYFMLKIDSDYDTIIISFLGYESRKLPLFKDRSFYMIPLSTSPQTLSKVVISAFEDRTSLLNTAGSVSILTGKELEYSNQLTLMPVLNQVAGVFIHSGTNTTNRITIRGIGARSPYSTTRIKVYFNDIPVTSGEGVTTMEDIEVSSLDEIEVIKGPVSSIYGAGLGGVILLSPLKAPYGSTIFKQQAIMGSFGMVKSSSSIASNTEKSNLMLNYSNTGTDGFRENSEYKRHSLTGNFQFFPGKKDILSVFANYTKLKAYIPSSIDSATFYNDPSSAAESWKEAKGYEDYHKLFGGITNKYSFSKKLENKSSFFIKYFDNYEPRPFDILKENQIAYGIRTAFQYDHKFGRAITNWILGTEIQNEWLDWKTFENANREEGELLTRLKERRLYYNIFGRLNIDFPRGTRISAGINFNRTTYEIKDQLTADSLDQSGKYAYDPVLSPFIGINQKTGPSNAIYFIASNGFAPPTVAETLTPEGLINTKIVPEKGINLETGLRGSALKGRLEYNLAGFYMYIKDKLVARRVGPDDYIGINAGSTLHTGFEAATRFKVVNLEEKIYLSINYTYGHYRFKEFVEEGIDYSGNELTGTIPHHLDSGLDLITRWGFYGNLNYRFTDRIPMLDDNSKYAEGYHLLHAKFGYEKTFTNKIGIDLFFGINNLTDTHYASMILVNAVAFGGGSPRFYYPGEPRNYYGGLSLRYIVNSK